MNKTKKTHMPFLEIGSKEYRIQKGGKDICDCYLWDEPGIAVQFFMCSKHRAAPDLLAAATRLRDALAAGDPQYSLSAEEGVALNDLNAAIAKAADKNV